MKQIKSDKRISRQDLDNPFHNMSYHDRLVKTGAIDLTDNCIIENLGNGYEKIKIIDESKKVK
jgi:hypothetical protein